MLEFEFFSKSLQTLYCLHAGDKGCFLHVYCYFYYWLTIVIWNFDSLKGIRYAFAAQTLLPIANNEGCFQYLCHVSLKNGGSEQAGTVCEK